VIVYDCGRCGREAYTITSCLSIANERYNEPPSTRHGTAPAHGREKENVGVKCEREARGIAQSV